MVGNVVYVVIFFHFFLVVSVKTSYKRNIRPTGVVISNQPSGLLKIPPFQPPTPAQPPPPLIFLNIFFFFFFFKGKTHYYVMMYFKVCVFCCCFSFKILLINELGGCKKRVGTDRQNGLKEADILDISVCRLF